MRGRPLPPSPTLFVVRPYFSFVVYNLIVIKEMDFLRLGKLALPTVKEPTDMFQAGSLEYYDKLYDR